MGFPEQKLTSIGRRDWKRWVDKRWENCEVGKTIEIGER